MLTEEQRQQVEGLFTRYGPGVGNYVLARVGDADVAEGITARVFLTVVDKFAQCRGAAVAWLWSIVRSEVARYFRDRKPTAPLEAGADHPDPAPAPPEQAASQEMRARMRAALGRLPEEQHRLVYLKFFLDMPNTEIARACGMTASNVGVSVFRALRHLRDLMGGGPDARVAPGKAARA